MLFYTSSSLNCEMEALGTMLFASYYRWNADVTIYFKGDDNEVDHMWQGEGGFTIWE